MSEIIDPGWGFVFIVIGLVCRPTDILSTISCTTLGLDIILKAFPDGNCIRVSVRILFGRLDTDFFPDKVGLTDKSSSDA